MGRRDFVSARDNPLDQEERNEDDLVGDGKRESIGKVDLHVVGNFGTVTVLVHMENSQLPQNNQGENLSSQENNIDIGSSQKDRDMETINKRNHEVTNKMGDEKHFSRGSGQGPAIIHADSTVNQASIGKQRFCLSRIFY